MSQDTHDRRLIELAKAGDFEAFDQLVTRHEGRVYSVAMNILRHREDAEDAVQTAFLNAFRHLSRFRQDAAFSTWITRIAVNVSLKALRKRKGLKTVSMDGRGNGEDAPIQHPKLIAHWRDDPFRLLERKNTRQILDHAIESLPEKQRVVFLLRDVQGLSVKETADVLSLSEANIKVRLLRARLALREKLTHVFGDERRQLKPDGDHAETSTPARALLRSYQSR